MPLPVAEEVLCKLEECLLDLDELGWVLAGAQLSHAAETVRDELTRMPDRLAPTALPAGDVDTSICKTLRPKSNQH